MKPRTKLAEARTTDGSILALYEHDGDFVISISGRELMHSKATTSELLLGTLGCERLKKKAANNVLIGGLGLGYTLNGALEKAGPNTRITVAELIPEVTDWNRTHLKGLNGFLLEDSRVEVIHTDVARLISDAKPEAYDVILLDVDNGPIAMVAKDNKKLYSFKGLRDIFRALKAGGRVVFWSAGPDKAFEQTLKNSRFKKVQAIPAKVHASAKRAAYILYVADRV